MRTLSIIIYCLLTVAASLLFLLQGSRRPRFIRFYRSMAEKEWARKGFILILAASAIAWNFACFISYGNSPWLLPGLVLSLSLLSYRLTHAVLWRLAGIRRILLAAYCTFPPVCVTGMAPPRTTGSRRLSSTTLPGGLRHQLRKTTHSRMRTITKLNWWNMPIRLVLTA